MRGQSAPLAPLTGEQRRFAEQNHGLIYAFLHKTGCDINEYYDTAALSFLQAVQRYLTQPQLRRYAFSTVAWRAMGSGIAAEYRAGERRRLAEQQYMMDCQTVSQDIRKEAEDRLILHELFSGASPEQRHLAQMRAQGFTMKEAADAQGIHVRQASRLLRDLRRSCALYI